MTFQSFPLSFSYFRARKLKNCPFFFTKAAKSHFVEFSLPSKDYRRRTSIIFLKTSSWNALLQKTDTVWSSQACLSDLEYAVGISNKYIWRGRRNLRPIYKNPFYNVFTGCFHFWPYSCQKVFVDQLMFFMQILRFYQWLRGDWFPLFVELAGQPHTAATVVVTANLQN
jgi:hypothetical protein